MSGNTTPPSYSGFRPVSEAASRSKSKLRRTDTKPELLLRRKLWSEGLRYRKNFNKLPGKPDIIFPKQKIAVFCDGDFWHGRNWTIRRAKLAAGANAAYWVAKIESNIARDVRVNHQLQELGWTVLRFWEGDLISDISSAVSAIKRHLGNLPS